MLQFQQQGDLSAFEQLFQRHRDPLFGFLLRLSANEAVAEDGSQQTWLRVVETARRGGYSANAAGFQTWLFTLARNWYIDEHVRRHESSRSITTDRVNEIADRRQSDDDEHENASHDTTALNETLLTLPFEQREVIVLWAYGFPMKQVADLTGAPLDTVISRKKYALQRLRKQLAEPAAVK